MKVVGPRGSKIFFLFARFKLAFCVSSSIQVSRQLASKDEDIQWQFWTQHEGVFIEEINCSCWQEKCACCCGFREPPASLSSEKHKIRMSPEIYSLSGLSNVRVIVCLKAQTTTTTTKLGPSLVFHQTHKLTTTLATSFARSQPGCQPSSAMRRPNLVATTKVNKLKEFSPSLPLFALQTIRRPPQIGMSTLFDSDEPPG